LGVRFRRQHAIGPFIVDFYCSECSLVIEVDGGIHELQIEQDAERQAFLEALGLKVLRFRDQEVLDHPERALKTIADNLTPSPSPTSERGA
jgi:very-short-patch-repair endonuclease